MTSTATFLPAPVGGSTVDLEAKVRITGLFLLNERAIARVTTDAALAHVQAMQELAALSFDPGSLERDLEDEINRNAWGISEA